MSLKLGSVGQHQDLVEPSVKSALIGRETNTELATLLVSGIFPPKTGGSGRWFWEIYSRLPRQNFLIAAGEDPRQEEFDRSHDEVGLCQTLQLEAAVYWIHGQSAAAEEAWRRAAEYARRANDRRQLTEILGWLASSVDPGQRLPAHCPGTADV